MKKEYIKPSVTVIALCDSEMILAESYPDPTPNQPIVIIIDGKKEEDPWDGVKFGDWEVD